MTRKDASDPGRGGSRRPSFILGTWREVLRLAKAIFDSRADWRARLLAALGLAYLVVPFDLVSDFIPVLGWLDDLAITPILLILARRYLGGADDRRTHL